MLSKIEFFNALCRDQWQVLPILSGLLLILAFHPFNVWPLAFIALAPLYYFVAAFPTRPKKEIFFGGFLTGALFALSLSYFTVVQFHWIPGAYIFVDLVHLSFIPIALAGGLMCGGMCTLAYYSLRSDSLLLNTLIGAAAYTAGEVVIYVLSGGYYFAMLAYTATPLPFLMAFAGIGGAFFVSFLIALCNSYIAAALVTIQHPHRPLRELGVAGLVILAGLVLLFGVNRAYTGPEGAPLRTLSVSIIQSQSRDGVGFGMDTQSVFFFPVLGERIKQAASSSPDLLIYPFSPVEGALYEGKKVVFNQSILRASEGSFTAWLTQLVSTSTTVMIWTTLYREPNFYNEFQFFKHGQFVSEYIKRDLFPFIDYTPLWAQKLGFYTTQVDMTPGDAGQAISPDGIAVGAMLCSEIHKQDLARGESARSSLIISAGSEAIFVDDVASEFSLKAAQFRAVENNIPVIRANLIGPSAIINRDGSFISHMDRGVGGVIAGSLLLYPPHPTLFSRFGNMPLVILLIGIFTIAVLKGMKHKHILWIKR